jgi:glycine oxidase
MLHFPPEPADPASMIKLLSLSQKIFPDWIRDLEETTRVKTRFCPMATLHLAYTDAEEKHLLNRLAFWQDQQIEAICLPSSEVTKLEPALVKGVRIAVLTDEGTIEPTRLLSALSKRLQQNGGILKAFEPVIEITKKNGLFQIKTPRGLYTAPQVVNAAGCWSGAIESPFPIAPILSDPIFGEILTIRTDPSLRLNHPISHFSPNSSDSSLWTYLVPHRGGLLRVGTTHQSNANFSQEPTAGGLFHLLGRASRILPGLLASQFVSVKAGLRPTSRDKLPLIGPSSIPDYFLATGHGGRGVTLAPATASLLAEAITLSKIPASLLPFSPSRPFP